MLLLTFLILYQFFSSEHFVTNCISFFCNILFFRCMGIQLCFSAIFTKGNNFCNFLFASHDNVAFPKKGSALKGKNLLLRSKLFPERVDLLKRRIFS